MADQPHPNGTRRTRFGLILTLVGFLIFLVGAKPELFNLDRSPVIGFLQIAVFLIGLAIICLGGYISMASLWNGYERSIAADIGLRLVATGYVLAVTAGLADVFGIGNQPWPQVPFFGPWQAGGVIIGEMAIIAGFVLMIPFKTPKKLDTPGAYPAHHQKV